MRSELLLVAFTACSLNTDLVRERDVGTRDAALDAALDGAVDAPGLDAPGLDAPGLDAPGFDADANDAGVDACATETCDGTDEDCDGRIDEDPSDCAEACVAAACVDSGNVLWSATLGSTAGDSTPARDRVTSLAATASRVFAGGDIQGDAFIWFDTHTPIGSDGMLAGMDSASGMPTSLATMSSAGGDVARGVTVVDDALWSVGVVTGTATIGEMTSTGATTGFLASFIPDASDAVAVTRVGQSTDLEVVVPFRDGIVAAGGLRGRLEHEGCPTVDALSVGLVIAPGEWCVTLGRTSDKIFPHAITVDGADDVYVAATYTEDVQVGGIDLDSGTGSGALLVKLNGEDGSVIWVRAVNPTSVGSRAGGNALTMAGDLVVFGGQVVGMHALVGAVATLVADDDDPYLIAFDSDGALEWMVVDDATFSGGVLALAFDRGSLYVAGSHGGIGFGCAMIPSVPGNGEDAFVARLDAATRDCRWIRSIASSSTDRARAIAIDPVRDVVYVGGELGDGAVIDSGIISVEGIGPDGFVAAYAR